MKKSYILFLLFPFIITHFSLAQDCQSTVILKLNNISTGEFFSNQTVEVVSISSTKVYTGITDIHGEVSFQLPCDERFNVTISNYADLVEIKSPSHANSKYTRNFSYEANMLEKREMFAMNETQKKVVDRAVANLPDTTFIHGSRMRQPRDVVNYTTLSITLIGLEQQYLVNEEIVFSGKKRKISFKAHTNSNGNARFYLPKGDVYTVNFKYHDNYSVEEVKYSKGTSNVRVKISYMGTKEFLRRKKAEEKRVEQERKRALMAQKNVSPEYKDDQVLEVVMDRNKWKNKLLISDVSAEMLTYALKLASWYDKNRKGDEYTQFVLYNNGQTSRGPKSGSAFHMISPEYQKLVDQINYVYANKGLETSNYNIEGLIVGDGIQKNYDDVILFVDKDASLMDYMYFKQLKAPVHIVLCVDSRRPNAQHLTIAWITKGSVHSLLKDYNNIGQLVEGDSFEMEGYTYKIMGGEFVLM